jgi:histidinol-phosphate aminotransferase
VLPEALRDQEYVKNYVEGVQHGRGLLERELRTLGLQYWSSHANFVLVRVGPAHAEFIQALRTRGILVRDRNSDPGCEGCVRLTVGSGEDMRPLIDALRGVIETINTPREVRG